MDCRQTDLIFRNTSYTSLRYSWIIFPLIFTTTERFTVVGLLSTIASVLIVRSYYYQLNCAVRQSSFISASTQCIVLLLKVKCAGAATRGAL